MFFVAFLRAVLLKLMITGLSRLTSCGDKAITQLLKAWVTKRQKPWISARDCSIAKTKAQFSADEAT